MIKLAVVEVDRQKILQKILEKIVKILENVTDHQHFNTWTSKSPECGSPICVALRQFSKRKKRPKCRHFGTQSWRYLRSLKQDSHEKNWSAKVQFWNNVMRIVAKLKVRKSAKLFQNRRVSRLTTGECESVGLWNIWEQTDFRVETPVDCYPTPQVVEHFKTHLDRCYRGPIVPGDLQSNCGAHGIKKAGRFADIKSD